MTRRDRRRCPRLGRARGDAPPATARAPRLLPAGSGSAAAAEAPEGAAPGSDDRVRRLGLVASARPRRQACAAWGNLGLGRRGPGRNPYRGGTPMWSEPGPGMNPDLGGTWTWSEPARGRNPDLGETRSWGDPAPGRNTDLVGTRTWEDAGPRSGWGLIGFLPERLSAWEDSGRTARCQLCRWTSTQNASQALPRDQFVGKNPKS